MKLPFGPPPVLPDVQKQLKEYLVRPDRLPIHDYERAQQFWPRQTDPSSLYNYDVTPAGSVLKFDRDPSTGRLLDFREVWVGDQGSTAKNSMSLSRAPGPTNEATRGSANSFPFWPGGFPEPSLDAFTDHLDGDIDFENDLLVVPPNFARGVEFGPDGFTKLTEVDKGTGTEELGPTPPVAAAGKEGRETGVINLTSVLREEEAVFLDLWKDTEADRAKEIKAAAKPAVHALAIDEELAEVVPKEDIVPVLRITETAPLQGPTSTKWAEVLDVSQPVTDFHQRIPDMAKVWEFELDPFQKQAILKLEEHANVFVAAHTSAGKTVVAEYAIALSQKNKTRAVYTSPIKALSNQKYRDFKNTFGDVGLITGDFQINQTASCLIMTTEILRSMLYRGSEVSRDLEYVIFDEVHYINDSERGHVWEEVLILLPAHVSIVMLSATVPNTLEFADWVGRTKQKKMYVISTLKRPVPLQHFLYTGSGGKSRDERFLVLDGDRVFNEAGYRAAVAAKKSRETAFATKYGQRDAGRVQMTPKQEKTMWIGLIDHLQKHDKLPVVAFTLSRNRCDQTSENLSSVDLTTSTEKHRIRAFFQQCIQKLKEPDRELPQVKKMQGLLMQGIGIHHSGILPILKEIVEMLFQEGRVKLLFATETFAMGVNMPARTVLFDSIRKFDGVSMRTLLPAEYIQMAGRAGRRGLDKTGTVIIICKGDVPALATLRDMMLGQPTRLQSKFRLTYSMILNLLRVQKISVEGMMSRSFKELDHQHSQGRYKRQLKAVEEEMERIGGSSQPGANYDQLLEFYCTASEFLQLWADVRSEVLRQPRAAKELVPGRVLLVSHQQHANKLALLLKVEALRKDEYRYKALVLVDRHGPHDGDDEVRLSVKDKPEGESRHRGEAWYKMMSFAAGEAIYVPDGVPDHVVLTLAPEDIFEITNRFIRVNTDIVYDDWTKRQNPRFRDAPVGPTCAQAVQELTELTHNVHSGNVKLEYSLLTRDLRVKDVDIVKKLARVSELRPTLYQFPCTKIANFEQQFEEVFHRKQLAEKIEKLKILQSDQSLSLYPEYMNRVKVLQSLKYIDRNNAVQLKGKVACDIGNHELMITELVLHNILLDLQPAEIAALLSCLVFQQRTSAQPQLTQALVDGTKIIQVIAEGIMLVEDAHGLQQDSGREFEKLNFGLTEVVYEWARGKRRLVLQAAVRPDHGADGRAGGHHRALHPAAERDAARRQGRGPHHRQPRAQAEDGGGLQRHQARHRVRGQPLHLSSTRPAYILYFIHIYGMTRSGTFLINSRFSFSHLKFGFFL
ncbi:superkiller complex protein 2 isoform X3 [Bacillus rossius redtenbacheri]|uniref:superkiller complex protein 2 isoform X3 n=1 Tax=Bacillus rossius redtenbacheri TaxID=93214 RepID=UPI002FDE2D85